jgi:serine kinase of HPr protein (carbohydrate metabolism regulator)
MTLIHASCVAIEGRGVLITGPSGAGKSDLVLRLIDRGATLVSDDQVAVEARAGRLFASAPTSISGKMEVRGIGIIAMAHTSPMPVALLIDLAARPERMPEPAVHALCGIDIPMVALAGFEASAAIKVHLALQQWALPA